MALPQKTDSDRLLTLEDRVAQQKILIDQMAAIIHRLTITHDALQRWQDGHHREAQRLSAIGSVLVLGAGVAAGLFIAGAL